MTNTHTRTGRGGNWFVYHREKGKKRKERLLVRLLGILGSFVGASVLVQEKSRAGGQHSPVV